MNIIKDEKYLHLEPQKIKMIFMDTFTGEKLGEFKEEEGKLTFDGKIDESGKVFVDFLLKTFNQRVEQMIKEKK